MTPTFRYNPAVVAQAFGTLGSLYPGRVLLGVGTGEALNEVVVGSVDSGRSSRSGSRRLREAVALMRKLWTEERVSFEGDYYASWTRPSTTGPSSRCRSTSPRAALSSPGMPAGPVTGSSAPRARVRSSTATSCSRPSTRGSPSPSRTRDDLDRMIEIKLSWDPDREQAVANCRFWAPLSLTAEQKHGTSDPVELERLGDELSDEQVA